MNKSAIRKFSVWARRKLIDDITYKAGMLGITAQGIALPLPQSTADMQVFDIGTKDLAQITGETIKQRESLVEAIKQKERASDYKNAFANVVEEIAYTWFNRLIAIRFMEVNDYLPGRVRVLSSENISKNEPDLVTNPFDADLMFSAEEQEEIMQLKMENKLDELFHMLFIRQCNALHEVLPMMFEEVSDYTELLLNISFTDADGVVYHLVHDIEEADWHEQVEIIGWMYQYYISEKHDEIVNIYAKKNIGKNDIPAATQLFTTDWVVRYMVDNSLGRYWIERNSESHLAEKLQFFVKSKDGSIDSIDEKIEPQQLTFFDPCMGSGHILAYAFDVLLEIYRECGYTDRDAVSEIVKHNIYGVDIDDRCSQLACFAVLMKARSIDRRFLTRGILPHVVSLQESNAVKKFASVAGLDDSDMNDIGQYLLNAFRDTKEIGSLKQIASKDYQGFIQYLKEWEANSPLDIENMLWKLDVLPLMLHLAKQAEILAKKYAVVCTNPPYMNKMDGRLKSFVNDNYKDYGADLFSIFVYRNFDFCVPHGYSAFMTPFVWMFIKTYEKLREYIINNKHLTSLIQFEYSAFEEATVPICSFVMQNSINDSPALCFRLSDFKGGMEVQKEKVLEAIANSDCGYFHEAKQSNFTKIPGAPVAYWVSEKIYEDYRKGTMLGNIVAPRKGNSTSNNAKFLRIWYEVEKQKMNIGNTVISKEDSKVRRWYPYNKGGGYRKWYGNNEYLVDWYNDAAEIRAIPTAVIANYQYFMKPGLTWSTVTSANFSIRWFDEGFIFDNGGCCIFELGERRKYILALLNSVVFKHIYGQLNPTLNFQSGEVAKFPVIDINKNKIDVLSENNVALSRTDWDSFETSWDFACHPLVSSAQSGPSQSSLRADSSPGGGAKGESAVNASMAQCGPSQSSLRADSSPKGGAKGAMLLADAFETWQQECNDRFNTLKANEEELNRIFIDIYGLADELTPEVEDKDVTVRKADLERDIKSLISYAVGCMFGRYSLDVDGLAYAGGAWQSAEVQEKYKTFLPDADNCIPITDEEYFEDDIVGLFCAWLKKVYGAATLEANLDYIAKALGNKGNTSREVIRNYFLKDFIKDHIKTYQKRPIYWLFDSGKQNGFKALVYMHRWNADTVGNVRVEYLHKVQHTYESEIVRMQEIIEDGSDNRAMSAAMKRKEKLQKQLKETVDYDALLSHIALDRIDIDLDDGVKVNYEKVQTDRTGKKMQILTKI